jgi:hypothetical protein
MRGKSVPDQYKFPLTELFAQFAEEGDQLLIGAAVRDDAEQ